MSLARNYFYRQSKFTAWREVKSSNGRDSEYIQLGSFDCTWSNDAVTKKTEDGREFIPSLAVFAKTDEVKRGDLIAIGEFDDILPIESAREVMKVETDRPLIGTQDYNYYAN